MRGDQGYDTVKGEVERTLETAGPKRLRDGIETGVCYWNGIIIWIEVKIKIDRKLN